MNCLSFTGIQLRLTLFVTAAIWLAAVSPLCAQDAGRPATEVQETVEDVLGDPEFRHLHVKETFDLEDQDVPDWLQRFLKWLFGGGNTTNTASSGSFWDFGDLLLYGLILLIIVVFVALMVSLFKTKESTLEVGMPGDFGDDEAIVPTRPPGDIASNEYERRALEAARAGDYRTAIRELVLGSMSWTERAGLIRFRIGLTNRDYVRAVWRQVARRESLLEIVSAFERVFYGRRLADAAMFEACLGEFQKSFASEAADVPTT